jgi:hypothetical protein
MWPPGEPLVCVVSLVRRQLAGPGLGLHAFPRAGPRARLVICQETKASGELGPDSCVPHELRNMIWCARDHAEVSSVGPRANCKDVHGGVAVERRTQHDLHSMSCEVAKLAIVGLVVLGRAHHRERLVYARSPVAVGGAFRRMCPPGSFSEFLHQMQSTHEL